MVIKKPILQETAGKQKAVIIVWPQIPLMILVDLWTLKMEVLNCSACAFSFFAFARRTAITTMPTVMLDEIVSATTTVASHVLYRVRASLFLKSLYSGQESDNHLVLALRI